MRLSPFTSVTRWLLVVVGCAVLATAQPMSAADESATRTAETVIYPKGSPQAGAPDFGYGSHAWIAALALCLALGGVWVLVQRRKTGVVGLDTKQLKIEETKSLGNRQYLLVASYKGQRFLLGVTPSQIQLISPLHDDDLTEGEGQ